MPRMILFANCIELAWYDIILTYYEQMKAKTARANLTLLYFQTFNSFLFPYFNSNILYSVNLFCIRWSFVINLFCLFYFIYSALNIRSLLKPRTYWVVDFTVFTHFYIKLKFSEIITVVNFVTIILLIETPYKFRTIKCWFTL